MWTKEGRIAVHQIVTKQRVLYAINFRLAKDYDSTPDEDLTYAHITESAFPGYAIITDPAFDVPTINGSGQAEGKTTAVLTWTAGTIITPEPIKAVIMEIQFVAGSAALAWIKKISPTVTLGAAGEVFSRYVDLFVDDIAALD